MRTFSQSVSTRLLSSLHVDKVPSLSQQHRHGSHRIQVHTNQYSQVPTFSLVPCPTLLNTVPTHSARDETQRVATKQAFHQQYCDWLCLIQARTSTLTDCAAAVLSKLFIEPQYHQLWR